MISADDIVRLIRRSLIVRLLGYAAMSALLATIVTRYSRYGDFFPDFLIVFFLAMLFATIVVYAGKYIPIINKHESLLHKYGAVYLVEAEKAIGKHGVERMLSTSWFEIYADELCEKESAERI